jgi:hypothetical protein
MPRGSKPGERRGGRQRGTPNKSTVLKKAAICAAASNFSPLDFFLRLMRDPNLPAELRVDMAKSAAPFVHTRRKERRLDLPKPLTSPPVAPVSGHVAGLTFRRSSEPSYSSARKMEGELNGGEAAGGADLSPLDYLSSVMNDADAKPGLRIKAARIAAPYLHSPPQPAKMEIVIEDPYGFDFDPAVARALRDDQVKLEVMYATRHLRPGDHVQHAKEEREVSVRIRELAKMLPKRHPPGYTRLQAMTDLKRVNELRDLRWSRHKLSKEDDAEWAHLNARFEIHYMTYAATPEARGRKRVNELRGLATLSDAERHELDELLKLYPPLPKPPEDRVKRAMLDYIEKSHREDAKRQAERQAQRKAR